MDSTFLPVSDQSDYPLHNLPYAIFSTADNMVPRVGVAIGDSVLDLQELGCFTGPEMAPRSHVFQKDKLNDFISLEKHAWQETRLTIQRILSKNEGYLRDDLLLQKRALIRQNDAKMYLPAKIGNFTDFSASKKHAENDRIMFTDKNQCILSNWNYVPVAYHSRASSIIVSGTPIRRPNGQFSSKITETESSLTPPIFGPSQKVDFEMEIGALMSGGNSLGRPISVDSADNHVFGFVLLNDWSARDIQSWEWKPLGPFLSKSYATSISPWVVTTAALEPFICQPLFLQDPEPLPYLRSRSTKTFDINLSATLKWQAAQPQLESGGVGTTSPTTVELSRSNYKHMYWTLAQQIAHHTSNGCNLLAGDLIGSGTVSGPTHDSSGSLSELSQGGSKPIDVGEGETRSFLQDQDEIIIHGWCQKEGLRIGFGECSGRILPAIQRIT